MAGLLFASSSQMANMGRSGYNKDGDSEDDKRCLNFGRSGYNKDGDSEDDKRNFGRSGYNKDGDSEDDSLRDPESRLTFPIIGGAQQNQMAHVPPSPSL
ncbi:hypothetical protein F4779DRAFT_619627 [Xylariaceae sp. FL0662B]|nr:hypothetical protein F4779DRAFT_619627 [Xylariaceae sp. FL0662B]